MYLFQTPTLGSPKLQVMYGRLLYGFFYTAPEIPHDAVQSPSRSRRNRYVMRHRRHHDTVMNYSAYLYMAVVKCVSVALAGMVAVGCTAWEMICMKILRQCLSMVLYYSVENLKVATLQRKLCRQYNKKRWKTFLKHTKKLKNRWNERMHKSE